LKDGTIKSGRRALGLTFSKAGATEMEQRLNVLLETLDLPATVGMKTLHSYCLKFLSDIGFMRGKTIMDDKVFFSAIREIADEAKLRGWDKYKHPEEFVSLLSLERGNMVKRADFLNSVIFRGSAISAENYEKMTAGLREYKARHNYIDYDDMLMFALYKLKTIPAYAEGIVDKYDCIMVDEAQDLSELQFRILKEMLGKSVLDDRAHYDHVRKTLVLIGDDDQCQPAGTKIRMADGSTKAIEDLRVGDKVLSYNVGARRYPMVNLWAEKEVTAVSKRVVNEIIEVVTKCGKVSRYTANHRCYVKSEYSDTLQEVLAENLNVGMSVPVAFETGSCNDIYFNEITNVGIGYGAWTVYGLNIEGLQNYVADDILTHNCIYEWRGSHPRGLVDVMTAYGLPKYTLSTNYRCPTEVLSPAIKTISLNRYSEPKQMNAHKSGGKFTYVSVKGCFSAESRYVAEQIKAAVDGGEETSSIAVLARNGYHLSLVKLYLRLFGLKSKLYGGKEGRTGADMIIHEIMDCFELYNSVSKSGDVMYCIFGGSKKDSEKLGSLIRAGGGTFVEWLEYAISLYDGSPVSKENPFTDMGSVWRAEFETLRRGGAFNTNTARGLLAAAKESEAAFYTRVVALYGDVTSYKYREYDINRVYRGTVEAFKDMLVNDTEAALKLIATWREQVRPRKNYITLSTMHSAKGREWNTVYIVCNDALALPSYTSISSLDALDASGKATLNFIEGERRLHYVGMTRAKDQLYVVGGTQQRGKFLLEAIADRE
jgi:superfamily I DNA/RNA helicase